VIASSPRLGRAFVPWSLRRAASAFEGPYQPQRTGFSRNVGWRGLLWRYRRHHQDLDPRLIRAHSGVLMIEDTAGLHDLCARIVAEQ
jgi:hypothetical protein